MKSIYKHVFLLIGLVFFGLCNVIAKPINATVGEFYENPLGYNLEDMTFSWQLPDEDNLSQSAYQIIVAKTPEMGKGDVIWDSDKIISSQSIKVDYPKTLQSATRLFWKVRYWDNNGKQSAWSDVQFFETGLFNENWKASWLSSSDNPTPADKTITFMGKVMTLKFRSVPPAYFRKEFYAPKNIKKARLYLASRGIAKAYINGRSIGNDYWSTGWTEYGKRVQSATYDITNILKRGHNAVGLAIADGWYCGTQAWCYIVRAGRPPLENYKPNVIAQIEIEFTDGTRQTISSDNTWKFSYGARLFADIYDGETYDARKTFGAWTSPNYNDKAWKSPQVEARAKLPLIEPRRCEPIKAMEVLEAQSIKKTSSGTFIVDFGQNLAGIPRLDMPAFKLGTTIKIRCAEILNKDGSFHTANYHTAKSTDVYISNGKPFKWEPIFTYHGFRYLEISGLPENFELSKKNLKAVSLRTASKMAGSFECSDALVNKLQSNIQWGQKSNFFSVPTDCPQRAERMGFTGDVQVFMPTALYNMNLNAFFIKWTTDLNDAQAANGVYPYYAPNLPKYAFATAGWSDCGVIAPWEIYLFYGDKKILRRNYEGMKKWLAYQKQASDNLIGKDTGIGDWLQPNPRPKAKKHAPHRYAPDASNSLISTAYFVRTANTLSKIAKVLEKNEDAKYYADLAQEVKKAYMARFVKADGTVESDCQTAYLMTLSNDIIQDKELEKKCFGKFLECIARDKYRLNTGFLGTPLLNPTLSKFGRTDIAYKLMMNTECPSWLYAVSQGATTIWETWAGERDMSFNHYAYGAIGEWLYKDVAGLWHDEKSVGFKNIMFAPKFEGIGFDWVKTSHATPYGIAKSEWKKENDQIVWKIKIPSNSTGTVVLPTKSTSANLDGKILNARVIQNLPSGEHIIKIKL